MTHIEAVRALEEAGFSEQELERLIVQQGEDPVVLLEQYRKENPDDHS